jgi:hypothetical protein
MIIADESSQVNSVDEQILFTLFINIEHDSSLQNGGNWTRLGKLLKKEQRLLAPSFVEYILHAVMNVLVWTTAISAHECSVGQQDFFSPPLIVLP